jgi:NADPH-dependent 2,4-dienoyl-CoA reductase/sulfur reductase-like enzyme
MSGAQTPGDVGCVSAMHQGYRPSSSPRYCCGERLLIRVSTREFPRIAIVGGGIGGLAVCAFLNRCGLAATVYEQAPMRG